MLEKTKEILDRNDFLYVDGTKFKYYCIPNVNHISKNYKGFVVFNNFNRYPTVQAIVADVKADDIFFLAEDYDLMDYTLEEIANFIQNLGVENNEKEE